MSDTNVHTNNHNKDETGRDPVIESYIQQTVEWAFGDVGTTRHSFIDLGCDYGYGAYHACAKGLADPAKTYGVELYGSSVPTVPVKIIREALDDPLLAHKLSKATNQSHFDLALLNHVLEHLMRPYDFMAAVNPLFRSGAQMMIAVPHVGYPWAYWEGHYTAWDSRILEKFMGHFGWSVSNTTKQCFRGDNVELWTLFQKD